MGYNKTLVINLLAGPGSGKSTMAAGIFAKLKWQGVECEIVPEFAKELVWDNSPSVMNDQIYIFGEQYHRIFRLLNKVEVIIVDSPLLLTPIYDKQKRNSLCRLVLDEHWKMWTYNVLLNRTKPFVQNGRLHGEEVAHAIDHDIRDFLDENGIEYTSIVASPDGEVYMVDKIVKLLLKMKSSL